MDFPAQHPIRTFWWRPTAATFFFGLALWVLLVARVPAAHAQDDRACDPPMYHGIQHCAHDGGQTHVVVVDLANSRVRLEVVMAAYQYNGKEVECTGVNVVRESTPGTGCSVPGAPGLYPTQPVLDMATRYIGKGAVAAINGDYMAANQTHGPEGFTVKNGVRYDGWRTGDCDGAPWYNRAFPDECFANDVSRPSLALSRLNQPDLSWKRSGDLENDRSYRSRFHNALGGGPLIVRGGQPIGDSAAACAAERFPTEVCTKTKQSGVGVTADLRRLVLVTSGVRDAAGIAQLMASPVYGVTTGMKLDGGGSSQMWVRQGDQGLYYYVTNDDFEARQLQVPVGRSVTQTIVPRDWPRPLAQSLVVLSTPIAAASVPTELDDFHHRSNPLASRLPIAY